MYSCTHACRRRHLLNYNLVYCPIRDTVQCQIAIKGYEFPSIKRAALKRLGFRRFVRLFLVCRLNEENACESLLLLSLKFPTFDGETLKH